MEVPLNNDFLPSLISSILILQLPVYADNLFNVFPQPEIMFQISDLYILLSAFVNRYLKGSLNSRFLLGYF